jgi:CDP-diacylglycerol--glycerol-3-phosphate 3-phosphatidyltransferase
LRRRLPNQLTILRLLLAALFFVALNCYRYPRGPDWAIWTAGVLFGLAAITDALDGYFARKWHAETTFGRIMDPFCDKVLIIGAFIYLSGPRFVIPEPKNPFFNMSTGVYPWMVALMLLRELIVTALRGHLEVTGVKFPARLFGKLKMILQSIGVPVILLIVWLDPETPTHRWLHVARDALVYAIVAVTVASGWPYVRAAAALLKRGHDEGPPRGDLGHEEGAKPVRGGASADLPPSR